MRRSRLPRRGEKIARAVRPNVGVTIAYRKRILRLVDAMQASYLHWIRAAYRQNPPRMAMDAPKTPAQRLQEAVDRMAAYWEARFDEGAEQMAEYFAQSVRRRSDHQLKAILRDSGYSVPFRPTPEMRDIMKATVEQNVQLIKSIPQQYLTQVQGAVMRSVQTGRDLVSLVGELEQQFGVTRRRAAFIALDQNNKATSAMQQARQVDLGIDEGIWMHSHAGKEPRPTHLANDGKRFNIKEGWYDPDPKVRRRIMPGELPRCRCSWKPIIPGFS